MSIDIRPTRVTVIEETAVEFSAETVKLLLLDQLGEFGSDGTSDTVDIRASRITDGGIKLSWTKKKTTQSIE